MTAELEAGFAPVNAAKYDKGRGIFDGITGFFDGLSNVVGSVGDVVEAGTDISDDVINARTILDDRRLDRAEREQDMLLDLFKVERGDNLTLYWVAGAAAVLGLFLVAR